VDFPIPGGPFRWMREVTGLGDTAAVSRASSV
jgi:hypothetical protein